MTPSAIKNREIKSREAIARADRAVKQSEGQLDRESQERRTDATNKTNLKAKLWGEAIRGASNVGSKLLGGVMGKSNDPAWYKSLMPDLSNFVTIPTYDRVGRTVYGPSYWSSDVDSFENAVPGIMIFSWIPTVGVQEDSATVHFRNSVNQTLTRMKEKVLATNSRSSTTWEPSDLGYNIYCSADIMSMILDLGRVIQVYQTYRSSNAYLAEALITALGWNFSDVEANYAEYRKEYQILATKFNSSIVAPLTVNLFKRRAFLAANIFTDCGKDDVRQMYAYKQSKAFILSDDAEFCNLTDISRSSLSSFVANIQLRFSRITDNADFIEMYQDLRHAFSDDIVKLPTDVTGQEIVFNNVELNRAAIHNIRILPHVAYGSKILSLTGWDLRQDASGYLYQGAVNGNTSERKVTYNLSTATAANSVEHFINQYLDDGKFNIYNMFTDKVSGDDILDITRTGFSGYTTINNEIVELTILNCASELMTEGTIYYMQYDGQSTRLNTLPFSTYHISEAGQTQPLDVATALSAFDWAPITHLCTDADGEWYVNTIMEADHTFKISNSELRDINYAAVMGVLYATDSNFKR